jgi:hypothetical protein
MRETGEEYLVLLTRFALERLLYRLTQLPEGDDFVLKRRLHLSPLGRQPGATNPGP